MAQNSKAQSVEFGQSFGQIAQGKATMAVASVAFSDGGNAVAISSSSYKGTKTVYLYSPEALQGVIDALTRAQNGHKWEAKAAKAPATATAATANAAFGPAEMLGMLQALGLVPAAAPVSAPLPAPAPAAAAPAPAETPNANAKRKAMLDEIARLKLANEELRKAQAAQPKA